MGTSERSAEAVLCRVCYQSFVPTSSDEGGVCPDCSPNRVIPKARRRNFSSSGGGDLQDQDPSSGGRKGARASFSPRRLSLAAAALAAITAAVGALTAPRPIRHPPGILVADEPLQEKIEDPRPWSKGNYEITPLATFRLKARVLSKARYWLGREADLAPYDLALGWGQMSDQAVLDRMKIWQDHRWYMYSYAYPPVAQGTIQTHSANMHIIPANPEVASRLGRVVPGHIIEITGSLVLVTAADGWRWRSSLSRGDTGASSCEVVWVEELFILP